MGFNSMKVRLKQREDANRYADMPRFNSMKVRLKQAINDFVNHQETSFNSMKVRLEPPQRQSCNLQLPVSIP